MIPIDKCIDGHIYKISARNGSFGLCKDNGRKFTLARNKFGETYLFDEYHWDVGAPYGTVKVLEDLGEYTDKMDKSLLNHLMQLEHDNKKE